MSFQIPCMRTEPDRTLDHLLSDYFTKGLAYLEVQEFFTCLPPATDWLVHYKKTFEET